MIAEGLQVLGNILSAATIAHPGRARAGERGRQASQTFDGRNRIGASPLTAITNAVSSASRAWPTTNAPVESL